MNVTKCTVTTTLATALALFSAGQDLLASAQEASPTPSVSCSSMPPASGMTGMMMGTPMAGDGHQMTGTAVEFDQVYIDMMLPHHASIIALARAAQERPTDERLQAIAENIITSQSAENEELRGYREGWYGSDEPTPMDGTMMGLMTEMMPGMGNMGDMQQQTNPRALVAAFCAGEDADLTFIALAIPHHEMAIRASEAALNQATRKEIRELAERVITDQRREIEELKQIAAEISDEATPASS